MLLWFKHGKWVFQADRIFLLSVLVKNTSQKFIPDIQEFSWWLGAKDGTILLNVQLIDFKITPDLISWEVVNSKDIQKYIWRYVNFDYDTIWIAEKTVTAIEKKESF